MLWVVLGVIVFLVLIVGQAVVGTAADGNVFAALVTVPAAFIAAFSFLAAAFCFIASLPGGIFVKNLEYAADCAVVGIIATVIQDIERFRPKCSRTNSKDAMKSP